MKMDKQLPSLFQMPGTRLDRGNNSEQDERSSLLLQSSESNREKWKITISLLCDKCQDRKVYSAMGSYTKGTWQLIDTYCTEERHLPEFAKSQINENWKSHL